MQWRLLTPIPCRMQSTKHTLLPIVVMLFCCRPLAPVSICSKVTKIAVKNSALACGSCVHHDDFCHLNQIYSTEHAYRLAFAVPVVCAYVLWFDYGGFIFCVICRADLQRCLVFCQAPRNLYRHGYCSCRISGECAYEPMAKILRPLFIADYFPVGYRTYSRYR